MRKLLALLAVVLLVSAAIYRERLYVRDPLAKVERNGQPVESARVFLNYSNSILLQEKGGTQMTVVETWSRAPATPTGLICIEGLLCLTPADRIADYNAAQQNDTPAQMSDREVSYMEHDGARVHVTLR